MWYSNEADFNTFVEHTQNKQASINELTLSNLILLKYLCLLHLVRYLKDIILYSLSLATYHKDIEFMDLCVLT